MNEHPEDQTPILPAPKKAELPFWAVAAIGFAMGIGSLVLSIVTMGFSFLGALIAAIVFLFIPGWRGMFVGFLLSVGFSALALVAICGGFK